MNKIYVASSFSNIENVRYVNDQLRNKGYELTYDWTQNARASTTEELRTIGQKEKDAVEEADFLIVLLPGGKGTHIEFGLALAQQKSIYLYSPENEADQVETTSTFYHLPQVKKCTGTLDELIERVIGGDNENK